MKQKPLLYSLLLLWGCLMLLAIPFWNDRVVQHYVNKIWLHRTNTVEKLQEFEEEYQSFECDVLFLSDPSRFEVGHDSASGVLLTPYLEFLGRFPDRKIWLDFKNLDTSNDSIAERLLSRMLAENRVEKNQLIIESRQWQALQRFTQAGYYTSCYLDIPDFTTLSGEKLSCVLDSLQQVARSGAVSALSFPASYYPILRNADFSVDLLTWEHRRWAWQLPFFSRSRAILKDSRVKVVLVKEKGNYHQ